MRPRIGKELAACLLGAVMLSSSGRIAQSQIAANFTLLNHTNGQPVRLYDLVGSIIVLEFFWTECGYCQVTTPQVKTGVKEYFQNIAGNTDGLPVTVLYVAYRDGQPASRVDWFMQTFGADFVVDDTPQNSVWYQFGNEHVPRFVVINGVTNSTTHQPWQIIANFTDYDTTPVPTLRAHINSVRGLLRPEWVNPRNLTNTYFRAAFRAQKGKTNVVQVSTNLVNWSALTNIVGSNTVRIFDHEMPQHSQRYYRVRVRQ
jgi:thiol-disulfide isomerase/thioredoxin